MRCLLLSLFISTILAFETSAQLNLKSKYPHGHFTIISKEKKYNDCYSPINGKISINFKLVFTSYPTLPMDFNFYFLDPASNSISYISNYTIDSNTNYNYHLHGDNNILEGLIEYFMGIEGTLVDGCEYYTFNIPFEIDISRYCYEGGIIDLDLKGFFGQETSSGIIPITVLYPEIYNEDCYDTEKTSTHPLTASHLTKEKIKICCGKENNSFDSDQGQLIYPNPNDGIFSVKTKNPISKLNLISGHLNIIKRLEFPKKTYKYNFSDLPSGIYLLEIEYYNGEKTLNKVIIF